VLVGEENKRDRRRQNSQPQVPTYSTNCTKSQLTTTKNDVEESQKERGKTAHTATHKQTQKKKGRNVSELEGKTARN
jgi:hypothetical protein